VPLPHHDGSELYVSNRAPKLGEKINLKIQVQKKDSVKNVYNKDLARWGASHLSIEEK